MCARHMSETHKPHGNNYREIGFTSVKRTTYTAGVEQWAFGRMLVCVCVDFVLAELLRHPNGALT